MKILLLLVFAIMPFFLPEAYLYYLGLALIFAVAVASWDLIVGYTGQVNLGHTTFIGFGAYMAAIVQTNPAFSVLFGGLAAAFLGFCIGVVTLRLKGYYFALVTAILPIVFMQKVFIFREIFRGEEGFTIVGFAFSTLEKYYIAFLFFFISLVTMHYILKSKVGLRFKAVRDSEELSESLGINTTKYKLLSFVLSSFFAGLSGAMLVNYRLTVAPDLYDVPLMLLIILSAVIGSLGTLLGPTIAAIFVYLAKNLLLKSMSFWIVNDEIVLYSLLIAIAILLPSGIYSEAKKLFLQLLSKPSR